MLGAKTQTFSFFNKSFRKFQIYIFPISKTYFYARSMIQITNYVKGMYNCKYFFYLFYNGISALKLFYVLCDKAIKQNNLL